MPITERTLRKWRKEALVALSSWSSISGDRSRMVAISEGEALIDRILRMTQELLDQHLLRKK